MNEVTRILSAIEQGEPHAADLRHAFHLAGARHVVSTLWSVHDDSTRDLMVDFMKAIAQPRPKGKAFALNEAQRRLMKSKWENLPRSHPYFWAAFALSGLDLP